MKTLVSFLLLVVSFSSFGQGASTADSAKAATRKWILRTLNKYAVPYERNDGPSHMKINGYKFRFQGNNLVVQHKTDYKIFAANNPSHLLSESYTKETNTFPVSSFKKVKLQLAGYKQSNTRVITFSSSYEAVKYTSADPAVCHDIEGSTDKKYNVNNHYDRAFVDIGFMINNQEDIVGQLNTAMQSLKIR
jgi:hypothetical protein